MTSLTDLKAAYEGLGYRVQRRGETLYFKPKGRAYWDNLEKRGLTPDLCDEMKTWMKNAGFSLMIALPESEYPVQISVLGKKLLAPIDVEAPTEAAALLACFLEVLKGEKP